MFIQNYLLFPRQSARISTKYLKYFSFPPSSKIQTHASTACTKHQPSIRFGFILTPTVVKDSILATGLMKVYHHGFDS